MEMISESGPHFTSDNHALLVGRVAGLLMNELAALPGTRYFVYPVMDEAKNWTDTILIRNETGQRWELTIKEVESETPIV